MKGTQVYPLGVVAGSNGFHTSGRASDNGISSGGGGGGIRPGIDVQKYPSRFGYRNHRIPRWVREKMPEHLFLFVRCQN